MNVKIIGGIGAGVAIIIIAIAAFSLSSNDDVQSTTSIEKITSVVSESSLGISYLVTNNELKQILETHDISMSSPIKLNDLREIWTYCNFFEGTEQQIVEYCTSTELRDPNDEFNLIMPCVFGSNKRSKERSMTSKIISTGILQCW